MILPVVFDQSSLVPLARLHSGLATALIDRLRLRWHEIDRLQDDLCLTTKTAESKVISKTEPAIRNGLLPKGALAEDALAVPRRILDQHVQAITTPAKLAMPDQPQVMSHESQGRVPVPKWSQPAQIGHQTWRNLRQPKLTVDFKHRLANGAPRLFRLRQILRHPGPHRARKSAAKVEEAGRRQRETGRHGMATIPDQQISTIRERLRHIATGNRTGRTGQQTITLPQQDDRPAILFSQPFGDDTDNPPVPVGVGKDDRRIFEHRRIPLEQGSSALRDQTSLQFAPCVHSLQLRGQFRRAAGIFRHQKFDTLPGITHPPRRVEPRHQASGNVCLVQLRGRKPRDLDQCPQPRPHRQPQSLNSTLQQVTGLFSLHRDIGHDPERHQIEQLT